MIPYDIDPSLHDSKPEPQELGDGFSPPAADAVQLVSPKDSAHELLGEKSPF